MPEDVRMDVQQAAEARVSLMYPRRRAGRALRYADAGICAGCGRGARLAPGQGNEAHLRFCGGCCKQRGYAGPGGWGHRELPERAERP
jgi:hypothetical protein